RVPSLRWAVIRVTVFFVGVGWALGMISSIFDAFDRSSLNRLIGVGQILYRVFGDFCFVRQTECACRLARALCSNWARIFSKIVRLGFEVAGQFGRAFV